MRLRKQAVEAQTDERWQEICRHRRELQGTWGLGGDEAGAGYRARLRRLCDFLAELQPELASAPDEASDFAKLRRGLAQAPPSSGAREAYLRRLEDLGQALEDLARADGEDDSRYWERLVKWSPPWGLPAPRRDDLERTLAVLLAADPKRPEVTARGCLQALSDQLDARKGDAPGDEARALLVAARAHWQECLSDCADDWEWAWLQVLLLHARECLRVKPSHPLRCQYARTAKAALEKAIPRLESKAFIQTQAQGLYGGLAAACLILGRAKETPQEERLLHVESALVYARHAVAMEPESTRERLVLLEVLAALGDPEGIKAQAEIAMNLDAGRDTLRTIGGSYWGRVAALRGRRARRMLLREAADFFARALNNVESAPLDERGPLDQIEAHAWAHFWLGRFLSERGRLAEASAHLRTAGMFGFKPLEAKVELAWTCLLARGRKDADEAFRMATEEADRWQAKGAGVAEAPGEERLVAELAFDAYLGWAFLCAEWDPDRALEKATHAEALLPAIAKPNEHELRGALHEVRGRVALRKRKVGASIEHLEKSVKLSPKSGAYCALGFANLALAGGAGTRTALRRAREAYRLGRDCDVRRRSSRELWELRRELRKRERQEELKVPPEV
jgi:tetratricopeptide (TPR) repeat protein